MEVRKFFDRTIVIGDIHGRQDWQDIIKYELQTGNPEFVFLGDYWDSFVIPFQLQLENFEEIVELKKSMPDRVTLLFGNHDYHYLQVDKQRYSGFQHKHHLTIEKTIQQYKDLFDVCVSRYDQYLLSHAGLSEKWCDTHFINLVPHDVNELFKTKPTAFGFIDRYGLVVDPTGDDIHQGPMWIRPRSLSMDALEGWIHVVGHTRQKEITEINGYEGRKIVCIDVLQERDDIQYLEITKEGHNAKTINRSFLHGGG